MSDVYVRLRRNVEVGRTEEVGRDHDLRVDHGLIRIGAAGLREVIVGIEVLGADGVAIDGHDARHDATTAAAAADAVTEIATDRARVREQRDRALDLADALSNCDDGTERARLRGELARLRRVVAGAAGTETGTDPEHPEEGR